MPTTINHQFVFHPLPPRPLSASLLEPASFRIQLNGLFNFPAFDWTPLLSPGQLVFVFFFFFFFLFCEPSCGGAPSRAEHQVRGGRASNVQVLQ